MCRWLRISCFQLPTREAQAVFTLALACPHLPTCAVALLYPTPPRPQIVLLGVCCSRGPGGAGDECEELTLQPLPLYSVPADNVTMVSVASTADGRIFMGGAGVRVGWGGVGGR